MKVRDEREVGSKGFQEEVGLRLGSLINGNTHDVNYEDTTEVSA